MRVRSWSRSHAVLVMALGAIAGIAVTVPRTAVSAPGTTWGEQRVGAGADTAGGGTGEAAAPRPRGPTLRDVLTEATTGNPDLRRERVAIDIARANILAAEGPFDYVLTGDGTFTRRVTPPIAGVSVPVTGYSEAFTANLGFARALESGGRISLSAQEIGTRSSQSQLCGQNASCTYHTAGMTLTFTHPLLRGFGSEVTLANLRKQRILHDIALLNRQARAAVVIRDVVTGYWEVAYAEDDLAIRRSAVVLAEEQRKYTQALIDVGRLGLAELAAVDRAIADRQQAVALAEEALLARALDIQRLMGHQVEAAFAPPGTPDRPSAAPLPVDPAVETAHALESSPQLRALRAGSTLSDIDIRTAQALVRPQLDFTGAVGTTGRQLEFSDTWAQAARFEYINWSAGLTFQLPLQNRAARGAEQAARASGERAQIDVATLELEIRNGVVRISAAARGATRRAELARASVGYAQKNLDAERARFEVGRSTNNDVLLRQQELKNAEVQVARANADLANAETALAALTGDILERYGIALRGS